MQESTEFWGPGPFLCTNTFAESVMCQQATAQFFLYQLWKTVSDLIYLFIIGCEMLFKILLKSKIWKEKKKKKYFWAKFIHSMRETSGRLLQILYSNIHSFQF